MNTSYTNFKMRNKDFEKLERFGNGDPDLGFRNLMSLIPKHGAKSLCNKIQEMTCFVDKYLVKVDASTGELLSDVFRSYMEYCNENNLSPMRKMQMVQQLESLGFMYGTGASNTRKIFGARCDWI